MSEIKSKEQGRRTPKWSILGQEYDSQRTKPEAERLRQIEGAVEFMPTEESASRTWATQAVIYALELCSPGIQKGQELPLEVSGEIAGASLALFMDHPHLAVEVLLAEDPKASSETPIMRALDDIFGTKRPETIQVSPNRLDLNKIAPEVPELSKKLVEYILVSQQFNKNSHG